MKIFFSVNKRARRRGRHKKKRDGWWHHIQEYVWPSIGVPAFLRFWEIKVKRTPGSVHEVAFGLAAGTFISFTPLVGLHSLGAILLCYLFGGSYLMGVVGTLVGNPWTFPIIWITTFNLGNLMLGVENPPEFPDQLVPQVILENLDVYFAAYLLPMTVSGVPLGVVVGYLMYRSVSWNLKRYRHSREKHLKKRRKVWKSLLSKTKDIGHKIGHKIHDIEENIEGKLHVSNKKKDDES